MRGKLLQTPYYKSKDIKKIDQGGFSVVYQVTLENQNVALKLFSKNIKISQATYDRLNPTFQLVKIYQKRIKH
ncbi:13188_t:CDS:2 [Gigaspora margarita]|uniref:13188_t:CDS:1 n=1 Tax=Gigaspora margarita TaxID=4874 RepID=A0ABN7UGN3_GIGMA|nr:13188_t:CDS:2 [Gigaspora margarita]